MSKNYPKIIYAQFQGEGDGEYIQAEKTADYLPDDGKIAIYQLKEVKQKRTEIHIE